MSVTVTPPPDAAPDRLHRSAWRWVHVAVAALAMILTLPGRTQGLGLFTEPLLRSLSLDRESYGFLNLWATLLGALFCLPCGWLLDRLGTRTVLLGVTTLLGAVVVAMSWWTTGAGAFTLALGLPAWLGGAVRVTVPVDLFVFLLLTRGLGQSALSVVSLALIGRAAGRQPGPAMGVFAVLTAVGFMAAFAILGRPNEWRPAWAGVGVAVLLLGPVAALLVRNQFLQADPGRTEAAPSDERSFRLGEALRSPTFWTFSLATSFLGMVLAGTSLFGESLMAERGLQESVLAPYGFPKVFVNVAFVGIPFGLAANLLVGWLASRTPLAWLMALSTGLFAAALVAFPWVTNEAEVYVYAAVLAAAGGGMTVCFFTVYRKAFGPARLGSIQGVAQLLTVVFSAVGPQVFASAKVRLGSYTPLFPVFAAVALGLAAAVWAAGLPRRPPISDDPRGAT